MQHVCVISTYPSTPCGIATYTRYLVGAVRKAEPRIRVSVLAEHGADETKTSRFQVLPIFHRENSYPETLARALSDLAPDVVHIQHEFGIFGHDERFIELLRQAKALGIKVVLTPHTIYPNEPFEPLDLEDKIQGYTRQLALLCDAVILHQQSMKTALVEQGVNEKSLHVIPHGTEILKRVSKTVARRRLGLPQKGKNILVFGFLGNNVSKGLIIDALPSILEKIPDAYVFFSGYVREESKNDLRAKGLYEQRAAELGVTERVIFSQGYLPDKDVHLAFSAADVAVLPYFHEDLSASGCLHLSLGAFKPIAVSNIMKFEEVWSDVSNEIVFKARDPDALAAVVARVLSDSTFEASLVEKIKDYALRTSWSTTAQRHLQIYNS